MNRRGLIPVWAPLLVMAAVILTGIVLGGVGTAYIVLFAVSAVVCTALVELRGLFLTVVLLPVYWFFGITGAGLAGGTSAASNLKTTLITAAYPAIEKFLWLAATFVICVIIAVVRQRIDAAVLQSQHRRERSRRRQMSDAEQSNQRLNARVRDYDRTSGEGQADRTDRPDRSTQATRPYRTTGDASDTRDTREERRTDDYPRYSAPRDENRRYSTRRDEPEKADSPETRTRTAAELREASRRRRSRSQDRPLDMD
ncbi:hypothetical protein BJF89_01890 [Corynebacterium sp. CNJ-954]|nr:hypothetical protein BJF89_01890 [Corynebacterium sp. CNJ-954]